MGGQVAFVAGCGNARNVLCRESHSVRISGVCRRYDNANSAAAHRCSQSRSRVTALVDANSNADHEEREKNSRRGVLKSSSELHAVSQPAENGNGKTTLSFVEKLKEQMPTSVERKKLLPLGLMFFMILFNYTILRDTKDVLVVTAAGAEIIPFLKTYCNLPGAIGFTLLYSSLANRLTREQLFYACLLPFVAFFLLFGFLMYPNASALHPIAFVTHLSTLLPPSFTAPLAILRNWTYALFYTAAELWGSVVVSVLFWGFANEVTSVKEAEKYYPLFGLGANVALIFSGQYVRFVSEVRRNLPAGVDGWAHSLKYLMAAVGIGGAVIAALYRYMTKVVLNDPEVIAAAEGSETAAMKKKRKKNAAAKNGGGAQTKMGIGESAKYLASSAYIRNLAMLVIAYGMSINIVEVTWKSRLRAAFPDPNDYSQFMGNFSSATGTFTFMMMLAGRFIFQKFGWGAAAMVTPVVLGITGLVFFGLTLFGAQVAPVISALGTTPLMMAVLVGAAQNVASKGSKYALFDPCKEMAYIPLDDEQRLKGKAAVDVIGNPLGKSGGSFIQQVLIFSLGSLAASTPYLAAILGLITFMWILAARSLSVQFKEKQAANARENEMDAASLGEDSSSNSSSRDGSGPVSSPGAFRPQPTGQPAASA
eukprot:CAMPEP_0185856544 /NCGR_PEP_ID=MMETSP1354-20130828/29049_1 /TAXON_ID=708628 /ORGANISM="Erythrolobus madagascarensis, Strain CCMP3276" /LENGTH=649 /DNA_ID=CAMNT_0028558801 /DNA_START=1084 /DNA_END=3033 /DNA_ORIENTATION=+